MVTCLESGTWCLTSAAAAGEALHVLQALDQGHIVGAGRIQLRTRLGQLLPQGRRAWSSTIAQSCLVRHVAKMPCFLLPHTRHGNLGAEHF